jgi:hypothetical protein
LPGEQAHNICEVKSRVLTPPKEGTEKSATKRRFDTATYQDGNIIALPLAPNTAKLRINKMIWLQRRHQWSGSQNRSHEPSPIQCGRENVIVLRYTYECDLSRRKRTDLREPLGASGSEPPLGIHTDYHTTSPLALPESYVRTIQSVRVRPISR